MTPLTDYRQRVDNSNHFDMKQCGSGSAVYGALQTKKVDEIETPMGVPPPVLIF